MRKYILTDHNGYTGSGVSISAGRHVQKDQSGGAIFSRINGDCYNSPLLATLLAPIAPIEGKTKLFSIDHWRISNDSNDPRGYTVIKEIKEIPAVTLLQKVDAAVAMVDIMHNHEAYRSWASNWLSGQDRTAAPARKTRTSLAEEKEVSRDLKALSGFGEIGEFNAHQTSAPEGFIERALHATRAAELIADGTQNMEAILQELTGAIAGLGGSDSGRNLGAIAEEIMRTDRD